MFFGPISIIPSLGCALIPNLSLLLRLEPFEKFLWWYLKAKLVIGLDPNLGLGA